MNIKAQILADTQSPFGPARMTTMLITYPRIILAEVNTHKMLSKNSASSRAIPTDHILKMVSDEPFTPTYWGQLQKGMQANQEVDPSRRLGAIQAWLEARMHALDYAKKMLDLGVHKQICNRILEPWMWMATVISGTDWENFFALRCHPDAQPEFQLLAFRMLEAYVQSAPIVATIHAPLADDVPAEDKITRLKVSAARCGRISYFKIDPKPIVDEVARADKFAEMNHWSPLEHQAVAHADHRHRSGNLKGWTQHRKFYTTENQTCDLKALYQSTKAAHPEW